MQHPSVTQQSAPARPSDKNSRKSRRGISLAGNPAVTRGGDVRRKAPPPSPSPAVRARPNGRQTVSAGPVCCCSSLGFPIAALSLMSVQEAESSRVRRSVVPSSRSTTREAGGVGGRRGVGVWLVVLSEPGCGTVFTFITGRSSRLQLFL